MLACDEVVGIGARHFCHAFAPLTVPHIMPAQCAYKMQLLFARGYPLKQANPPFWLRILTVEPTNAVYGGRAQLCCMKIRSFFVVLLSLSLFEIFFFALSPMPLVCFELSRFSFSFWRLAAKSCSCHNFRDIQSMTMLVTVISIAYAIHTLGNVQRALS